MIRLEFPRAELERYANDTDKIYALKRQVDMLTNNLQIVLDSIEDDTEVGSVTNIIYEGSGDTPTPVGTETDPVFTASPAHNISSSDITNWNGKSNFSGNYNDLTNKPAIPTNTSDLTNDSGYITTSIYNGTCSSAGSDATKVVTCSDFTLFTGVAILVTFSYTNSATVANLQMDVNGTGAKKIKYINNGTLGNLVSAGYLKTNTTYLFIYDGTYWVAYFNYNTTYSGMTDAEITAGTGTANRLITPARLKTAVQTWESVSSVNGQTGAVSLVIPTVPTNISAFTNDSGYITGYTETDPTVPSWAKQSTKPSYTASEVGALPSTTAIPSKTSDLTNDSGFITGYTETDPTVPSWAKASTKPSYSASEVSFSETTPRYISGNDVGQALTDLETAIGDIADDCDNINWGNTTVAYALSTLWANQLPTVTASDNGKVLRVVNGAWSAVALPSASGVSF